MDATASVLKSSFPTSPDISNEEYDRIAKQHVKQVDILLARHSQQVLEHCTELLKVIDPRRNSISYLAVLEVVLQDGQTAHKSESPFLEQLVTFCLTFESRQIRYAGKSFSNLVKALLSTNLILPHEQTIDVVARALLRLDPNGAILTSHHLQLVDFALSSGHVDPIYQIIDKHIVFYPTVDQKLGHKDYICDLSAPSYTYISVETGFTGILWPTQILDYDFQCGLLHCMRRRWTQALDAFARVITYPCKDGGTSKIMAEAYKKWVLVHLLATGKAQSSVPSPTASATNKALEALAKPYKTLATHFESPSPTALAKEYESNTKLWEEDQNVGLVQAVLDAYQAWQVINLGNIYSTISISAIRSKTTPVQGDATSQTDANIEQLITSIIQRGELKAVLEPASGDKPPHLRFLPAEQTLTEAELDKRMTQAAAQIQTLGPVFKVNRERMGTTREYLRHVVDEQKRQADTAANKRGGADGDVTMGDTFERMVENEDLLVG